MAFANINKGLVRELLIRPHSPDRGLVRWVQLDQGSCVAHHQADWNSELKAAARLIQELLVFGVLLADADSKPAAKDNLRATVTWQNFANMLDIVSRVDYLDHDTTPVSWDYSSRRVRPGHEVADHLAMGIRADSFGRVGPQDKTVSATFWDRRLSPRQANRYGDHVAFSPYYK